MRMRVRTEGIQLIREMTDTKTEKIKYEVVGFLPRKTLELKDEVREKLKPAEIREVEVFVGRLKEGRSLAQKAAAFNLSLTVADALDYFRTVRDASERNYLNAQFTQAIAQLRKATS